MIIRFFFGLEILESVNGYTAYYDELLIRKHSIRFIKSNCLYSTSGISSNTISIYNVYYT